jgi:TPR repeat protein
LSRRIASDGSSDRAEYLYPLGVRALAERDYARAAGLFSRAAEQNPRQAGALAAYAMCRSGRRDRAAAVPGADLLAQDLRCWSAKR